VAERKHVIDPGQLMDDEGEDRVKAGYRGNHERLVAIKNKYDPANVFRVNQNLKPSAP